jgi:hypothetical protein
LQAAHKFLKAILLTPFWCQFPNINNTTGRYWSTQEILNLYETQRVMMHCILVLLVMMLCSQMGKYQILRGTCCLHIVSWRWRYYCCLKLLYPSIRPCGFLIKITTWTITTLKTSSCILICSITIFQTVYSSLYLQKPANVPYSAVYKFSSRIHTQSL